MKKPQDQYTVRIDGPITDEALRKFALVVSDALTRLSKLTSKTNVVNATSVQGSTSSWELALYDEDTGLIAFLPGVRFVPVGANDVNVGFELDVSPRVGSGIGGTSQGYMANYGTVGGSKLAAGMSANNEDPNIPRLDLGFKPKRGATMEFYGSDGDALNTRKGELRATLGPGGKLIIYRYVSGDTWEVIGGFGPNGELVCGFKNYWWPGDGVDGDGLPVANPPDVTAVFNVYAQPTSGTTNDPVATIDKAGVISGTKLKLNHGTGHSVTLDPAAATGAVTLTLQQKTFKDDSVAWVLCAAVS